MKGTIDEFLEFVVENNGEVTEQLDAGRKYIVVTFTYHDRGLKTDKEVETWFDPKVNFLVRKKTYKARLAGDKKLLVEFEVLEFAEPEPGVFFPVKSRNRNYFDGKLKATVTAAVSDLLINKKLSADVSQLTIPAGTTLADAATSRSYPSDSKGNPIGPSEPLLTKLPGRVKSPTAPSGEVGKQSSSDSEIFTTRFFLLVFSIVLFLGAAWVALRSRKAGATTLGK